MRFVIVFLVFIFAVIMAAPQSKLQFGDNGKFVNKVNEIRYHYYY